MMKHKPQQFWISVTIKASQVSEEYSHLHDMFEKLDQFKSADDLQQIHVSAHLLY